MILRFAVLVEHRLVTDRHRQTDGHRPMASTADAWHRVVKLDMITRVTFVDSRLRPGSCEWYTYTLYIASVVRICAENFHIFAV